MKFRETFTEGPILSDPATAADSQIPRRRLLIAFLVLVVVAFPGLLHAQFNYMITTNLTVTITGYKGPTGTVVVPSSLGGLPVTSIANGVFGNAAVTNITFPYTLTNIVAGGNVFQNCWSLLTINVDVNNPAYGSAGGVLFDKNLRTLLQFPYAIAGSYAVPGTVTNIGVGAFANCILTSVTIPDSVLNIGDYAFASCDLATVTFGTNLAAIGAYAFSGCAGLSSIALPHSLTSLGTYAFSDCGLMSASMGNNVKVISDSAFSYTRLTSFTIPAGVTEIGIDAFGYCYNLQGVIIPNTVTKIGRAAFEQCPLIGLTIPDGVRDIEANAFLNCGDLASVIIPDSVINLGNSAFAGCSHLTHVTIGSGITNIADGTFAGTGLTGITIPNTVTSMGGYVFSGCMGLSSISIPDSIANLGSWTFQYCSNLTDVVIGSGLTNIWYEAFSYCPRLNNVYFRGNAPSVTEPFEFLYADVSIIHYLPWTTGWGPVFANRPAILWLPQIVTEDSSFGVKNRAFGFNVFWTSGINVLVEGSTDLAKSVWVPLATNNITTGSFYFADPQWTNYPGRFYRVRSL